MVFKNLCFLNPFNAEATFVQSTQTLKPLKTMPTLSCWYSLESCHWVLSDEYPFARVSFFFHVFFHHFILAKLATSSIRVNCALDEGAWALEGVLLVLLQIPSTKCRPDSWYAWACSFYKHRQDGVDICLGLKLTTFFLIVNNCQ